MCLLNKSMKLIFLTFLKLLISCIFWKRSDIIKMLKNWIFRVDSVTLLQGIDSLGQEIKRGGKNSEALWN